MSLITKFIATKIMQKKEFFFSRDFPTGLWLQSTLQPRSEIADTSTMVDGDFQ